MKFRIGNIFLFLYFKYFSFLSSNLMTRVMINDATEKLKRSDDISAYLTLINIPACILKILAQKFHKNCNLYIHQNRNYQTLITCNYCFFPNTLSQLKTFNLRVSIWSLWWNIHSFHEMACTGVISSSSLMRDNIKLRR